MKIGEFPSEEPRGPFLDNVTFGLFTNHSDGILTQIELDIDERHKVCIQFDEYQGYKIVSPHFLYIETKIGEKGREIDRIGNIDHILEYSKNNFDKLKQVKVEKFFMEII